MEYETYLGTNTYNQKIITQKSVKKNHTSLTFKAVCIITFVAKLTPLEPNWMTALQPFSLAWFMYSSISYKK